MTEFQINDYLLQTECEGLARDIFEEAQRDGGDDFDPEAERDDMMDRTHEVADGHEWVIYNHKALMLCAHCDVSMGEEFLEDVGIPEEPTLYKIACMIAYAEMRRRIEIAIEEMIDAFEPAEA